MLRLSGSARTDKLYCDASGERLRKTGRRGGGENAERGSSRLSRMCCFTRLTAFSEFFLYTTGSKPQCGQEIESRQRKIIKSSAMPRLIAKNTMALGSKS